LNYHKLSFGIIERLKNKSTVESTVAPTVNISISKSKSINKSKSNYTIEFESYWKEYPKRKDKGHAFSEWQKQIKTTDTQTIIDGAKKYAVECSGKDVQFIKMAQGWLSGQRWLDELSGSVNVSDSRFDFIPDDHK